MGVAGQTIIESRTLVEARRLRDFWPRLHGAQDGLRRCHAESGSRRKSIKLREGFSDETPWCDRCCPDPKRSRGCCQPVLASSAGSEVAQYQVRWWRQLDCQQREHGETVSRRSRW